MKHTTNHSFFGSEGNTALLVVLIIMMAAALFWMMTTKDATVNALPFPSEVKQ